MGQPFEGESLQLFFVPEEHRPGAEARGAEESDGGSKQSAGDGAVKRVTSLVAADAKDSFEGQGGRIFSGGDAEHDSCCAAAEVPLIDCQRLFSVNHEEAAEEQRLLRRACEEWGFFNIINHGVDDIIFKGMKQEAAAFFSLPLEEKRKMNRTEQNAWGYSNDELTKQTRDWKELMDIGFTPREDLPAEDEMNRTFDGVNFWPDDTLLPHFRSTMLRYYHTMESLASRLLLSVARCLHLPPDTFASHFSPQHSSFLRLNFYPPCPSPDQVLGVNRHTDAGCLTLLFHETEGLQVLRREAERGRGGEKDRRGGAHGGMGRWIDVKPVEGALTINIGDMMQIWTNGIFTAPLHRVLVKRDTERYSAPFFFNPSYETTVQPLGELLESGRDAKYAPVKWLDFRKLRYEGDIADKGEEIQIERFQAGR